MSSSLLYSRRSVVASLASISMLPSALSASSASPGSLSGANLTFYVSDERGDMAFTSADLIQANLAASTGANVRVIAMPGRGGNAALQAVAESADGELAFAAVDLLSLQVWEAVLPASSQLEKVRAAGLLCKGMTACLLVGQGSSYGSANELIAASKTRSVKVGHVGRLTQMGPPLGLLEVSTDTEFHDVTYSNKEAVIAALQEGAIDAAILDTMDVMGFKKLGVPVQPLLTFGGERNPHLDVQTLRELATGTDSKNTAVACGAALFYSANMDTKLAESVIGEIQRTMQSQEVLDLAKMRPFPLHFGATKDFDEAFNRNSRIIGLVKNRLFVS